MTSSTRKLSLLSAAGLMAVMLSGPDAQAATGFGNTDAVVLETLVISEQQSLAFGSFEPGPAPGTVSISTAGDRSTSGGVTTGPEIATQAQFDIGGTASSSISFAAITGITLTSGGNIMTVVFDTSGAPTSLSASGAATLNVGATLAVPPGQAAGNYTGSFTVTVSYN